MKFIKIIIFICVIFIVFTACSDNNNIDPGGNNLNNNNTPETEESKEILSPFTDDVKFNGEEIRILNCSYYTEDGVFLNAEQQNGDIVNDSIYRRNSKVQGDLNINFKFTDISLVGGDDFGKTVRNFVMAGSDDYDLLVNAQYDCVQLATANVFTNLNNAPYINLAQPWWPAGYIREMAIGKDNLYFLTGDISLVFVRQMSCVYFNKEVYAEYFGDPDDMYKLVLDGKWTLDKLSDMGKGMYRDLNGNGLYDDDDQYAYGVLPANLTDHFMLDAGIRLTARDSDGLPYFIMNNEKTAAFTEKLYSLFYENEGSRVFPPTNESNNITIPKKFMRNELLFDFGWFYISELLRDMKADYGIIPFPKYDENQPEYLSLAHDIVPLYCVPITCDKLDIIGAALELLAFETYKTVLPTYFEIALKLKYIRDSTDDAFKIIDMIHDNCTTDFAYIYTMSLNNIGHIMRELMQAKSSDFVSRYERIEPRIQASLEKIIEAYLQNDN